MENTAFSCLVVADLHILPSFEIERERFEFLEILNYHFPYCVHV